MFCAVSLIRDSAIRMKIASMIALRPVCFFAFLVSDSLEPNDFLLPNKTDGVG